MKYVRTKYGHIYEIVGTVNQPNRPHDGYLINSRGYNVIPEDVIKQSDDIEELFDWVVLKLKENGRICRLYKNLELATECEGNGILRFQILGAIETEYDLIYVAEMNDEKGEWELL